MKKYLAFVLLILLFQNGNSQKYKNFKVSIYCTAYDVSRMNDTVSYLLPVWNEITRQLKVDKIYLETHRDLLIVDQKTLNIAKKFFKARGLEVAGGITYTVKESDHFKTFCYNDPDDRKKVMEIAEYTAENFDEFILDDFFFTSCKTAEAIEDKGSRNWTQYRLELMAEAAQDLVVGPSKKINPDVKIIIKFPNWYEHFQGLGFNLKEEPEIFDGIYTGTETRDAVLSEQHLQQYLGYNIFRYFENIAPGRNMGGWVDPFGMNYYDRYAEQLWITAFTGAPEITLFHFGQLSNPVDSVYKSPWQGFNCSFDFKKMMYPVNFNGGNPLPPTTLARVAGYSLESVDKIMDETGNPVGIKSYKPYHSTGENFLPDFLGMIGLPMDENPEFPSEEPLILLTEKAKFDSSIVSKIKNQLSAGKKVVITSGLLKALQNRGFDDIVELRYTDRKALVQDFALNRISLVHGDKPVLIQQIAYYTNDSWEIISGVDGPNGWPLLHMADYSGGKLFVLVIPDNFADLYVLPPEVLDKIREVLCSELDVSIGGPAKVSLYLYDNKTFIVESFNDKPTMLRIYTLDKYSEITDLTSNISFEGKQAGKIPGRNTGIRLNKNVYSFTLMPHSYRLFRYK